MARRMSTIAFAIREATVPLGIPRIWAISSRE
jgi:hypothetical protein